MENLNNKTINGEIKLMDKIKLAQTTINTLKDYVEILKVHPRMKQDFNKKVVDEQIKLNEEDIKQNVAKMLGIKLD